MLHQAASYVTGCNDPCCTAHSQLKKSVSLELQYSDRKHDIELKVNVNTSLSTTIHSITEDLLKFLYLDDMRLEEVHLIGFSNKSNFYRLDETNTSKTLQEFGLTNACILYFEPTLTAAAPKQCQLKIIGPNEQNEEMFQWYREKTTLGMLFEYVIEKFSLKSIEREQIHLFTIFSELDLVSDSRKRLSELSIYDRMTIHVQIIKMSSSKIKDESTDIHVECDDGCKIFTVDIPVNQRIVDLKIQIQKQYENKYISELKLFNKKDDQFHFIDDDQNLKSLGIKPSQKIFANYHLTTEKTQHAILNNQNKASNQSSSSSSSSSSSLSTKNSNDTVTVICKFPTNIQEKIEVSLQDTVDNLIKKIDVLKQSKRLIVHKLSSGAIDFLITIKSDRFQSLADLGFESEKIIDAIIIDRPLKYSSIVGKQSSSLVKTDKSSKTDSLKEMPIGLDNLGNTCYMNSALQCLAHIPPLTAFFLEGLERTQKLMNDDEHTDNDWNPYDQVGDLIGAYADLLWNLWIQTENDYDYDSFKPSRIKKIIGNIKSDFATNEQHDAQEFMSFFLEVIHKELKENNNKDKYTIIKQLFFGEIKSIIKCMRCNNEKSIVSPITFLSIPLNRQERTFWITYISKTGKDEVCSVHVPIIGQVGHVVEEFVKSYQRPSLFYYILAMLPDGELDFKTPLSDISYDEIILIEQEERSNNSQPEFLPISMRKETLENCLQEFFSLECLDDERTCQEEKCKKKMLATKQLQLTKLPPVLMIQFKRFFHENGIHQKIETFVKYPIKTLNLKKFSPAYQGEAVYDLIATCNHIGSIHGGHYTASVMHQVLNKSEWYMLDDSCVTRVKPEDIESNIMSRDAYLLFYIRRDYLDGTKVL